MNSTKYDALVRRDPAFEGTFVYAVTTTGVYCRPTCKSRRPLERNVRFFTDAAGARAAGFRSCKRCRPDDPAHALQPAWLTQACRLLETAADVPTLDELAAHVGVSRAHVQRTFSRAIGVSPRRYAAAMRDCPVWYRRGAAGMGVAYGIVTTALGVVLVAATERGIAHVALGDDPAVLERELRAAYPRAQLERADDRLESATSALVRYLAAAGPWPRLPLDVRATAFQARVWDALQRIAPGKTTSYGELARALGDPQATRAVARACATNPVALLIPCHRVVAKDGELRGYRWGVERQRRLLDLERSAS